MATIRTETGIEASPEVCFDLSRDVRAHASSTASTGERVVFAPASGMLELGDEVEFEARHLGIRQRLRSKIIEYDRPHRFVDQMQRGAFKRLRHTHEFHQTRTGTMMIDVMEFQLPCGWLGAVIDRLFLAGYMRRFLEVRNRELKRLAETHTHSQPPA